MMREFPLQRADYKLDDVQDLLHRYQLYMHPTMLKNWALVVSGKIADTFMERKSNRLN